MKPAQSESCAATSATSPFSVEQMIALKRAQAVALSPCGRWAALALERLLSDGSQYACDIWRVALDGKTAPLQLTSGKSRDTDPQFRADGALAFLSNREDSELPEASREGRKQIWLLPSQGGEPLRLSDEPLGVMSFRFASKGNALLILTLVLPAVAHEAQRTTDDQRRKTGSSALHYRSMPVRFWDHWLPMAAPHLVLCKQDGSQRLDLTPEAQRELLHAEFDISSDGMQAAVTWSQPGADRISDTALMLFDLRAWQTAEADNPVVHTRLLAAQSLCEASQPLFSPDGSQLIYRCKARLPHQSHQWSLCLLDLVANTSRRLAPNWDAWPIPAVWHSDGKSVFVTAEELGSNAVFALELQSGDVVRMSDHGSHSHLHYEPQREFLLGLRSSIRHPPEIFILTCNDSTELHFPARMSGFDEQAVPFKMQELHIPSSDGVAIQAWLLQPSQAEQPVPTLLWTHGGPINAWNDVWHWRWNPLLAVAQGYAVILPNPRGSTGFGQKFVDGIWGNQWGAQCYQDLMAVVDHVATLPEIDGQRMAAMGGSFGGYMTNWIGTQTTRFNCLITHASVYSMSGFTGHVDEPAYWYLEMDAQPYSDPVAFDRYSPSRYVANWKSPTLIIHGDKDYRVPVNEGLALFEALQYHGVESELLIFPDENHWILKPNNSIVWYQTVFGFLQKHMAGTAC